MVKTSPFNAGAMSLIPGGDPSVKEPCNAGDTGLIPGSSRAPGGGHSNPLQYSCRLQSIVSQTV